MSGYTLKNRQLSWPQVQDIRRRYSSTKRNASSLGREYDLSYSAILHLVRYKTYKLSPPQVLQGREKLKAIRLIRRRATEKGLDVLQVEKVVERKKCDICGRREGSKRRKTLAVDHKGKTVRGLLCMRCNIALGHVQDSIIILKNMIKYLRKNAS